MSDNSSIYAADQNSEILTIHDRRASDLCQSFLHNDNFKLKYYGEANHLGNNPKIYAWCWFAPYTMNQLK